MWWDKIRKLWDTNQQPIEHTPLSREYRCQPACQLARERGQSLVEFAVILPLLLLIVLATVDLGMGFKTYIALTNAAREGARWISIHPSDQAGAKDRIDEEAERVGLMDGILVENGYGVSFSPNKSKYSAGEKVTVNVEFEYELLFGAITGLPAIPFTASSTMVVLYDE
jgi:Flp pilus assembly protein TadG